MTSRLVIGTPRIPAKPPRRHPCAEARRLASNLLPNPGVESGPEKSLGYLPLADSLQADNLIRDSAGNPVPHGGVSYVQSDFDNPALVTVSTASPRSGTSHLRFDSTSTDADTKEIYYHPAFWCFVNFSPNAVAFCAAGDLVTVSVWAKTNLQYTQVELWPKIELHIDFLTSAGSAISGASHTSLWTTIALTTYTNYNFSAVAPTNAYAAHTYITLYPGTPGAGFTATVVDLDDGACGVT